MEKNIQNILDRIKEKCIESNRDPSEITLVAVSKQNPIEKIVRVENFGLKDFGENRAQELKQKAEVLSLDVNWHFIGHLQSNKVKDVVPFAYLIHSVDSIKLANEINKRAANIGKIQNILLEVKTSTEESKYGIETFETIYELAKHCKKLSNLNLLGLMTMAPFTPDDDKIRSSFKLLKNIFNDLNKKDFGLKELSMGMTNDFEVAIEEGATILRIGTAIFKSKY